MKRMTVRLALGLVFLWGMGSSMGSKVYARGEILGIHILSPGEVGKADALLENGDDKDKFVTVPITLNDVGKKSDWQHFFDECHRLKLRPILRLTTKFENGNWAQPTRKDVMQLAQFITSLEWHRPEVTIIAYNEPNHAREWGGTIDPEDFEKISNFTVDWFKTEPKTYTMLPAAMDLAADGRNGTMEAFTYWKRVLAQNPTFFEKFDAWNSHSYPNPAFASSPKRTDKMSLRGYEHELAFIKNYTQKQFPVYITETGWNQNALTNARFRSYFKDAYENIWSKDDRIVAVTPFILQGAPGTFAPFSFLDKDGNPTIAYETYKGILNRKN